MEPEESSNFEKHNKVELKKVHVPIRKLLFKLPFNDSQPGYSDMQLTSPLKCHVQRQRFQFCFWGPLPVNGGFLGNHTLIIIDHHKLCWRSLCSSLVGPLWNITVFLCLSGMRGNFGVTAAVLTLMSVLTFSLMSLLCLWCKRKSSKCVYYRLDRGDCSW